MGEAAVRAAKAVIEFGSVVSGAEIGEGVFIKHLSCVEKVTIFSRKSCGIFSGNQY
jgi:carbonic anhydrase/acetyltransferase-like protein (isoleucine patch superfamily)